MTTLGVIIPSWSSMGVLPPISPGQPGHSKDRSPYKVDLSTFVSRFMTSQERINILKLLLQFRGELYKLGIISGFQWIDGSFLENIEVLESRSPRDMDIITFFNLPEGGDQTSLVEKAGNIFNHDYLKTNFAMDAYFIVLGQPTDEWQIKNISYWYSMWSHRRDGLWKGFIQIDLDPSQDLDANAIIGNINGGV